MYHKKSLTTSDPQDAVDTNRKAFVNPSAPWGLTQSTSTIHCKTTTQNTHKTAIYNPFWSLSTLPAEPISQGIAFTFFQNSVPTWFPHCPTCKQMISLGMCGDGSLLTENFLAVYAWSITGNFLSARSLCLNQNGSNELPHKIWTQLQKLLSHLRSFLLISAGRVKFQCISVQSSLFGFERFVRGISL